MCRRYSSGEWNIFDLLEDMRGQIGTKRFGSDQFNPAFQYFVQKE